VALGVQPVQELHAWPPSRRVPVVAVSTWPSLFEARSKTKNRRTAARAAEIEPL